jgi:hypothetical protein
MAKEPAFVPRAEAESVRQKIAATGKAALEKLATELQQLQKRERLPESWVKNFKAVADQLRRDYRLEGEADAGDVEARVAGFDPLAGLRVAESEDAA